MSECQHRSLLQVGERVSHSGVGAAAELLWAERRIGAANVRE